MRVHNERYIKVCISGSKARLQFVCLAQQKKEGDYRQSQEEHTWHQTAPNESINHVFGLKIQRAPGAAARGLLQHIATISTRLCAHGRWSTDFKFSKEAIRDLLRKDVMHYSTGPGTLVPLDSLDKVFGKSQGDVR